ncbi:hypothetical protein [Mycobacterium uberis]|uniref:hypothetical protein n=1 Tax=Mycobacterium uberis TaxID=2162698 RepID=UPI0014025044|nr:hypothetical protein [Mycobacterium uberis]
MADLYLVASLDSVISELIVGLCLSLSSVSMAPAIMRYVAVAKTPPLRRLSKPAS